MTECNTRQTRRVAMLQRPRSWLVARRIFLSHATLGLATNQAGVECPSARPAPGLPWVEEVSVRPAAGTDENAAASKSLCPLRFLGVRHSSFHSSIFRRTSCKLVSSWKSGLWLPCTDRSSHMPNGPMFRPGRWRGTGPFPNAAWIGGRGRWLHGCSLKLRHCGEPGLGHARSPRKYW